MTAPMYSHADAHRYRVALEQIISTLGPTVPMCGCMARCKSCRGGLHAEATDVLKIAREAVRKESGR